MADKQAELLSLTVDIVANYLQANKMAQADLPGLIATVHAALGSAGTVEAVEPETARATPAQIRRSIRPEGLVSFEDGRPYKTLRRHLTTRGLTVAEYKAKWGLPADYPTTAPDYSAKRSAMAKQLGLGQKGRSSKAPAKAKRPTKK